MPDTIYVTEQDVTDTCARMGLSDWTDLKDAQIDASEAEKLRQVIGAETLEISLGDFHLGLEIELEHGRRFPDANVTNNHPVLTAKIVLAHLKESLDYYVRLDCMELETEVFDAMLSRDLPRLLQKRSQLAMRRQALEKRLLARLKSAS